MWNSEAPLEILSGMPHELNRANLERLQQVIDVDKYRNSFELGRDLCGEYAPFCSNCDKELDCPCAVAYVKMKQEEGMEVAIAAYEPAPEDIAQPTESRKKIRIAVAKRKH